MSIHPYSTVHDTEMAINRSIAQRSKDAQTLCTNLVRAISDNPPQNLDEWEDWNRGIHNQLADLQYVLNRLSVETYHGFRELS